MIMDYEKKYNEALGRARSMYESRDDAELAAYIFPELRESEDERIRKFLLDYAIEMIASLESDISLSTYDGIKGHDPDAEAELNQWQKARAYLEKQKEQKPVEIHIDNPNVQKFDPDVKVTTSDSSASGKELLYVSNKSYNIGYRDGVNSVKPAEWSEE